MTTYKLKKPSVDTQDIIYRLRKRADIRRQIPNRKSVQLGEPDRIADLLEEAVNEIEVVRKQLAKQNVTLALVDLLGSYKLAMQWWETRNLGLGAAPSSVWETDPHKVVDYVMGCIS